jgi:hypothetical protein
MDEHYARQSGNLERILAAEEKRAQILRSVPLGAGALGGAIFDVVHAKERAQIADTLDSAARGNAKADFMQEVNARKAAERAAVRALELEAVQRGATAPFQAELFRTRRDINDMQPGEVRDALVKKEKDLRSRQAAETENLERSHAHRMIRIREEFYAESLEAQGYSEAAAYAKFEGALKAQEAAIEEAKDRALNAGDQEEYKRKAAEQDAVHALNTNRAANFLRAQEEGRAKALDAMQGDAADFMRGAGGAAVEKADRERGIAEEARQARFEARQEQLNRRADTRARAEFEAINEKARRELDKAEDPDLRRSIEARTVEELKTLRAELGGGGGRRVRAEAVQNAGTTFFGAGSDTRDQVRLLDQIDKTLKDIARKEPVAVAG